MLSICKNHRYEKCKKEMIKLFEFKKQIKYPIEIMNYKSRGDIPIICSLDNFNDILKTMEIKTEDWTKNIYDDKSEIKIGIKIIDGKLGDKKE